MPHKIERCHSPATNDRDVRKAGVTGVTLMRRRRAQILTIIATVVATAVHAAPAKRDATSPKRAAAALALPFERFRLANGLTVIVQTDRKAPVVTVLVRYAVGAKHENPDRSGFAHLFEHMMYGTSDTRPDGYKELLRDMGATGFTGKTTYDDTVFDQTVPTAALARALFLEANRMGHMGGSITQLMLDSHRSVVKNEKRQTENVPGVLAYEATSSRLLPKGHPFNHSVLGSMAMLDAATVADAHAWHERYYRPNNATLVLSGDVDLASAKTLVTRYFGNLRAGAPVVSPDVPIPTLPAPLSDVAYDAVPGLSVTRHWTTPGSSRGDGTALDVAAKVLGTLNGVWLDQALVREGLVTSLTTSAGQSADIATFVIAYEVARGVDPARVSARLDEVLARFVRVGPSEDEIRRVAMRDIGWQTMRLETSSGKALLLSDGQLHTGNPLAYRDTLLAETKLKPRQLSDAISRWLLRRPAYTLTIVPGTRPPYVETKESVPTRTVVANAVSRPVIPDALPPIGAPAPLRFPVVERVRLSNGIEILYARRGGVPLTSVSMTFEGGGAADPVGQAGTQAFLVRMLSEGTADRDGAAIMRERQRMGAEMSFESGRDRTIADLVVPSAAFMRALDLMSDIVRNPAMKPLAVERIRAERLAALRQTSGMPEMLAQRAMARLLFGASSTYSQDSAYGDPQVIAGMTAARLLELHRQWIRADKARIFVVSDLPIAEVRAAAERAFGNWHANGPAGVTTPFVRQQATPRILLVDRPNSSQSVILGATRTPILTTDEQFAASVANDSLGGFYGRISLDLREQRGWTYNFNGSFQRWEQAGAYTVSTLVQADRTGDSLALIRRYMTDYVGNAPMTDRELKQAVDAAEANLPGRFESGASVMATMKSDEWFGRADDYPTTLPARYRALDRATVMEGFRKAFDPAQMLWVVVGDSRTVRPQLDRLGLPVVVSTATAAP